MPVGVPYVEYTLPGSEEPEFINLYNALYRERMLFLCQEIEDTIANELIGLMLYLNAEDPSRALFLYINSPGGSVTCGIGIYDIMRYLNSGITTICMGTAASMASFILAGGTYGRRYALPHSRIMIHQPEGGSDGQASEILSESVEVARIRRQVGLIYANRTQQSIDRIAQDLDRDQFMSAKEARAYGLVDAVALLKDQYGFVGYDLLGLDDEFKLPDFLKKLAQGSLGMPEEPATGPFDDAPVGDSFPVTAAQTEARMLQVIGDPLMSSLPALFSPPSDDQQVDLSDRARLERAVASIDLPADTSDDDPEDEYLPEITWDSLDNGSSEEDPFEGLPLDAPLVDASELVDEKKIASRASSTFTVDVDPPPAAVSSVPFSGPLSPTPEFASAFAAIALTKTGGQDVDLYDSYLSDADEPAPEDTAE